MSLSGQLLLFVLCVLHSWEVDRQQCMLQMPYNIAPIIIAGSLGLLDVNSSRESLQQPLYLPRSTQDGLFVSRQK